MSMIVPVPESFVLIRKAGVYKHSFLGFRDDRLYANYGSGWAKLFADGTSSVKGLTWQDPEATAYNIIKAGCYMTAVLKAGKSKLAAE